MWRVRGRNQPLLTAKSLRKDEDAILFGASQIVRISDDIQIDECGLITVRLVKYGTGVERPGFGLQAQDQKGSHGLAQPFATSQA
jgi:hypothetical protein